MASPVLGNVAVGDIFQCQLVSELYGQTLRTVLHYRVAEAPTAATDRYAFYDVIASKLDTEIAGNAFSRIVAIQSQDVLTRYTQFQVVRPSRLVFKRNLLSGTGAAAETPGALNSAGYILKKTSFAGRNAIGSVHVGGIPTTHIAQGKWDVDTQDSLADIATSIRAELFDEGLGYQLIPCLAPHVGALTLPFYVTDAIASVEVRTMRRRTLRVGE